MVSTRAIEQQDAYDRLCSAVQTRGGRVLLPREAPAAWGLFIVLGEEKGSPHRAFGCYFPALLELQVHAVLALEWLQRVAPHGKGDREVKDEEEETSA
jgi:hypothetical protein